MLVRAWTWETEPAIREVGGGSLRGLLLCKLWVPLRLMEVLIVWYSLFLGVAAYLIFGSWLNYNRYGARGYYSRSLSSHSPPPPPSLPI